MLLTARGWAVRRQRRVVVAEQAAHSLALTSLNGSKLRTLQGLEGDERATVVHAVAGNLLLPPSMPDDSMPIADSMLAESMSAHDAGLRSAEASSQDQKRLAGLELYRPWEAGVARPLVWPGWRGLISPPELATDSAPVFRLGVQVWVDRLTVRPQQLAPHAGRTYGTSSSEVKAAVGL